MKTELVNIDHIPNEAELKSLLGVGVYSYYKKLCEIIVSLLSPDLELWDNAGRRGKYFHGYRVYRLSLTVDLYLSSISGQGQITCGFHFNKRYFSKIFKHRDSLNTDQAQKAIDFSVKFNEEFGGGYSVSIIIRENEDFLDTLEIVKMVAINNLKIRN